MTRSVSRSATSLVGRAAYGCAVLAEPGHERRLPQRQRGAAARGAVVGDGGDVQPGEPAGRRPRARRRWPRRARRWGGRRRAPRLAAADAGSGRRGRRRRRGSGGTRRRPRSAARRRTATSARGRAAASGAACRGWSRTYSPWSRVHSRISGVESPSWVPSAQVGQPRLAEPAQRGELVLGQRLGRSEVEDARRRAAPWDRARTRSRAAPAAGSPATCPTPCRSR